MTDIEKLNVQKEPDYILNLINAQQGTKIVKPYHSDNAETMKLRDDKFQVFKETRVKVKVLKDQMILIKEDQAKVGQIPKTLDFAFKIV